MLTNNKVAISKWLRVGLLCLGIMLVVICAVIGADAEEADIKLESKYPLGTEIQIPAPPAGAAAMVRDPSGAVYRVGDTFTPTRDGIHTLIYAGSGNAWRQEQEFLVAAPLYAVGNPRSSVTLGKYAYGDYEIDRTAILASISSTDRFSYSRIVDLKELDGQSFLEFFVTPENIGTCDAVKINIILTDLYDPENFVTISVKRGVGSSGAAWLEKTSYITANAADQPPTGLERNKGDLEIDGTMYLLHKNNVWGAGVPFAPAGNPGYVSVSEPNNVPEKVGSQTLALRFDWETNSVYANERLVTMLSGETIYGKNVWDGFTTGECLITVEGAEYNASALNLAITKIGQDNVTENGVVNPAFEKNEFTDTQAPVVTVSLPDGDTCPNAISGMAYPLFPAQAVDDYSKELQLRTAVYYNYGTDRQVRLSITDNCFVPFQAGVYTAVYTGVDAYGNVGSAFVEITAEDGNASVLQAEIADPADGLAGQAYPVPVPTFRHSRGDVSWQATAKLEGREISYSISSDEPSFVPEYAGTYEIVYSFRDYIYAATVSKKLTVSASDQPVFLGEPVLPRYLLKGCVYALPVIDARLYTTGEPAAAVPQIYVVEDGGTEKLADYRYAPYAKESVRFIYRLENNGKTAEYRSDPIPVLDVGYNGSYRIDRYFVCNGVTAEPAAKYIRLKFAEDGAETGSATFANALQMFNFSLRMTAAGTGFERINLYLTDYADKDVTVKLTYRQAGGAVYFSINDGEEYRLAETAFQDPDLPLSLNIWENGTVVMPTGVSSLCYEIHSDTNGEPFTGFTEERAYLTVEMEGVENAKRTGIDIFSISNQMVSGIYVDNIKPALSASSAVGARPVGTEYVLEPVYYADVLDPSCACVMYVTAPDGSYAVTVDGVVLDPTAAKPSMRYTLRFDLLGDYVVNYSVKDIAGNELTYSYVLKSVDTTPPTVEIQNPVKQGKVSEKIPLAQIKISDNFGTPTDQFVVYVSVITPQGQTYAMLDAAGKVADTFTATHPGIYTVQYMVIGPSGNLTLTGYPVDIQ